VKEILFPDRFDFLPGLLISKAYGLNFHLGVFVLFEIEEEAALSLMKIGTISAESLE
jgi:uncharacterized protein YebE (UPF0316 family)